MSLFTELMKSELPSKADQAYLESDENLDDVDTGSDVDESDEDDITDGSDTEESFEDELDDLDDIELSDDELDELEDELGDGDEDLDDIPDDIEDDLSEIDSNEECPPSPLEGEEDVEADNMMAVAATPLLIKDELSVEESVAFYGSEDAEILVSEGMILDSMLGEVFEEGVFANPNTKFKMTKAARFKQLYEISVQIEARMHNDPDYAILQKLYALERAKKKKLRAKYHALAIRRAKIYLKRIAKSKSGVLSKIGKKLGLKR